MERRQGRMLGIPLVLAALISGCRDTALQPEAPSGTSVVLAQASAVAGMYAPDFVSTAATGYDLNDAGDVVGKSYRDTGCGPFCLPLEDIVVWRGGNRIVLPTIPGFGGYQFPKFINTTGLVAGFVGYPGATTHAALWTPGSTGYTGQDLGVLPGMSSADVAGLDDQGRMVGWSSIGGAIPTATAPFMWSQATGMVDLKAQGYPNERPAAISPGGKVVTTNSWYQLGIPGVSTPLPAVPQGFSGVGSNGSDINDAGDQAHFLVSINSQNLVYPFRLSNGGAWQMISSSGTGHLSRAGIGSINSAQDITFTVLSTAMIAPGPAGVGRALAPLLSPAYPGATIGVAGPMNNAGQILTQVMIGRSQRLMKLTPVSPCGTNCIVVGSLVMTGQFVQDPTFPGSCFQGGKMYNLSTARVTVTNETGAALGNVQVSGRFLDDYWTDNVVTGITNASGVVTWSYKGLCGVGAIAFLVDKAILGTRSLDRTRGTLSGYVIPSITPPANQPPAARFTVTCSPGKCVLNAGSSTDDHGIVSYSWKASVSKRPVKTGVKITRGWLASGGNTYLETLTVMDGNGLSSSVSKQITIPPTP